MLRPRSTFGPAVLTLLLVSIAAQGALAAQPANNSSSPTANDTTIDGVLIIRGGGVLEGTITRVDDRYHVTREGVELNVAADRVALVCHSLADAYQRQREQMQSDDAEAHLSLAEWCVRYGLASEAIRELNDAKRLEPRHPRLLLLKRRLRAASERTEARAQQKEMDEHGQQEAAEEMRQLEAAIEDLPPGAVERFTRKVQPLLVNNCTTAGCHQSNSEQEYQLDRAVVHGLSNRRTTLRNLTATLELIDRTRPHDSPILTISRQSHGGMERPIFGSRQADQLRQLIDWVALVTDPTVDEPRFAESSPPIETRTSGAAVTAAPAVRPVNFEEELPTLRPKQPLQYGAQITPWQPKDPFDPEIFNRQNRAATAQAAESPAPNGANVVSP